MKRDWKVVTRRRPVEPAVRIAARGVSGHRCKNPPNSSPASTGTDHRPMTAPQVRMAGPEDAPEAPRDEHPTNESFA